MKTNLQKRHKQHKVRKVRLINIDLIKSMLLLVNNYWLIVFVEKKKVTIYTSKAQQTISQ